MSPDLVLGGDGECQEKSQQATGSPSGTSEQETRVLNRHDKQGLPGDHQMVGSG